MTNNFTPAKAGGQRPRLSKEEYAEKMRKEKEAVYQMADETATGIVASPEKFKAFLDTQSRLDRYSAVNALLIFKQLPEASQLKNFDDCGILFFVFRQITELVAVMQIQPIQSADLFYFVFSCRQSVLSDDYRLICKRH